MAVTFCLLNKQCERVQFVLHPHQHWILPFKKLTSAILVTVWWHPIVYLICIPLVHNDVAHLFICLFAFYTISCDVVV